MDKKLRILVILNIAGRARFSLASNLYLSYQGIRRILQSVDRVWMEQFYSLLLTHYPSIYLFRKVVVCGQYDRTTSFIWSDKFMLKVYGYNLSIASFCSCFFISSASKTGQLFWLSDAKKMLLLNSLKSGEKSWSFNFYC